MRRAVPLAVAVAAAVFGLALAFVPALQSVATAPETVPSILAGIALVAGLARAWGWLRHSPDLTAMPDRERRRPVEVPGDDLDDLLGRIPAIGTVAGDRSALRAREELRTAAVAVLVRYRGLSEAEAVDRLESGTWTDDRLAAEFFATVDGTGSSVRESVAGALWDEGPFRRRARHVAAAIHDVATGGET